MKIATILGTRPEIIKLSQIIPKLDNYTDHALIHTGQNYTKTLNDIFFSDLGVRKPDYILKTKSNTTMGMVGKILEQCYDLFQKISPDKVLILGDTYSGLSAIAAKKLGIPIYHMEAGNRCYDDRVPEEANRRIIDTISDIQMPYTQRSKEILLGEGYKPNKIFVIGNPIYEVFKNYEKQIGQSQVMDKIGVKPKHFFLLTLHRAETVDHKERLNTILKALGKVVETYKLPIICSMHPHTADRIAHEKLVIPKGLIILEPLGFFDFVNLEMNCFCAISDSGTIQEEGAIFHIPQVLIRDATERYETIDSGSNLVTGIDEDSIYNAVQFVVNERTDWPVPVDYTKTNVSDTVLRILLSNWQKL
ncbi:UDP-N-acetylglucosamine 2-epimerase (non-hydrolyzing) [Candidatus Shapirobacteria bacterium CG10_big_fil_rev_8_21_14_0_10_36_6]|uniref:UDP-N-acetylglucosamine 2-epimerase (Non-hydrolyzing) n=1 Tax=Candidatus Shapirobacteria bacterium CG10_big_fil_rev_8_21_14_0_10_36_6 TaxID=1974886 RepID=A0A2M8L1E8_9BACT|nr:MAG: UDP-N-acetylglucosamine 2-epimerase (non-hydrolyzing) [Candidatus Shapirobacteria bacterium CG10_big_fil_rev_8_21_14_0_10_36_6]